MWNANKRRERRQLDLEMTADFYRNKVEGIDLAFGSLRLMKNDYINVTEFYNDGINQCPALVMTDFKDWHVRKLKKTTYRLLDNPFVLDPASKIELLRWDSGLQQRTESRRGALTLGNLAFITPYLVIEVDRNNLLEDALNQLIRAQIGPSSSNSASRLKKPLRIIFKGEEGVDQGGVAKEFFQLLVEQLFNPDFGMFVFHPETRYMWLQKDSMEAFIQFELVGIVLGLALYNNIILDINFPLAIYKKLLSSDGNTTLAKPFRSTATGGLTPADPGTGNPSPADPGTGNPSPADMPSHMRNSAAMLMDFLLPGAAASGFNLALDSNNGELNDDTSLPAYEPCLEDLEEFDPMVVKSLRQLLAMPPGQVSDLCLTFSVDVECFGATTTLDLKTKEIVANDALESLEVVTAENREEFVKTILRYYLVDSIKPQFDAFYKGFHRCCGGPVLKLFHATELNLAICGSPGDLDFHQLEEGTQYQDGYTADSPTVKYFWRVAHSLPQEEKKKLLFFITGKENALVWPSFQGPTARQ